MTIDRKRKLRHSSVREGVALLGKLPRKGLGMGAPGSVVMW
jgi:hypothetical protein